MSQQALKEWASICGWLLHGKLIALLRKGGLADNPDVFEKSDHGFWLHPTHFHEQRSSLRDGWSLPEMDWEIEAGSRIGEIPIPAYCRLTGSYQIHRLETALAWARISPYAEDTVRTRFNYRQPGIQLHTVRVFQVSPAIWVKDKPEWAGCKSFHEIGIDPKSIPKTPVLNDDAYRREVLRVEEVLRPTAYA